MRIENMNDLIHLPNILVSVTRFLITKFLIYISFLI